MFRCSFLCQCVSIYAFYKIFQGYIVFHKITFPSEIPRHTVSPTAAGGKCSDLWVETGLKAIHQSSAISTNYYRIQSEIHILILLYKSSSGSLLHCLTDYLCTCKSSHSWDWLYHSWTWFFDLNVRELEADIFINLLCTFLLHIFLQDSMKIII